MKFSALLAQSILWRGIYFVTLFVVNLLLSRYLQAAGSGEIFYISNTFAFIQLLAGLSFENGITYFAAGKLMSPNQLLWLCLLWTGCVVVLELLAFSFISFSGIDAHIPFYAFCFITGLLLTIYSTNLLYAEGDFFTSNCILGAYNLLLILIMMGFAIFDLDKKVLILIYFFNMLCQGITIVLAYIVKRKSWREFSLPPIVNIKKFIAYSISVLLFNVLLFLVYRIDYYFVHQSNTATATDLGNYIQASKLGQMLLVVPQIIGSVVYPQVSSGISLTTVSNSIIIILKWLAVLYILLFILVLLTGNWLFPFVFGQTFQNMQVPFLILLPGIYGLSVIALLSNFFSGKGNVGISVRAASLALVIVVGGNLLLVNRFGIIAAAAVSSVGYLTMMSLYISRFAKDSNATFTKFFQWTTADFALLKNIIFRQLYK